MDNQANFNRYPQERTPGLARLPFGEDKCSQADSPAVAGYHLEELDMTTHDERAIELAARLSDCATLSKSSPEKDELWIAVRDVVCTRSVCLVTPMGSSSPVPVTSDHASQELIAAMEWLIAHEEQARTLAPMELFIMLRGVATKGAIGSARSAQSDALHGMTHVSPGEPVTFAEIDRTDVA
ncbi:hypothetical protein [Humibacillus xanthopallidus]|nr:hypothetical protein [Humibacillus xanthopallidus]